MKRRYRLVVVAIETGGRWSQEAVDSVNSNAGARVRAAPPLLRGSAFFFWERRRMTMLSVSCGRSIGSSLVSARANPVRGPDGLSRHARETNRQHGRLHPDSISEYVA